MRVKDFVELEPLSPDLKKKLLDFDDMKDDPTSTELYLNPTSPPISIPAEEIIITNNQEDEAKGKKKSDYKRAPRMNTFVGFLRLANYINASCVIFGVVASILMEEEKSQKSVLEVRKEEASF